MLPFKPVRIYAVLSVGATRNESSLWLWHATPRYACVGPQVCRNSQKVLDYPSFMDKLPMHHWESLLWLMRCAKESYKDIADHQVLSHIHRAKKSVPYKTFTTTNPQSGSTKYFGGIAFGSNVYLRCHTDQDFTMSISQVFCMVLLEKNIHLWIIVIAIRRVALRKTIVVINMVQRSEWMILYSTVTFGCIEMTFPTRR